MYLLVVVTIQYGVSVAGFSGLLAEAMPTVANMASPRMRATMRWPNAWTVPLWTYRQSEVPTTRMMATDRIRQSDRLFQTAPVKRFAILPNVSVMADEPSAMRSIVAAAAHRLLPMDRKMPVMLAGTASNHERGLNMLTSSTRLVRPPMVFDQRRIGRQSSPWLQTLLSPSREVRSAAARVMVAFSSISASMTVLRLPYAARW